MLSHHFIGTGPCSHRLASLAGEPSRLNDVVRDTVTACGLAVMAEQRVVFDNGGLTLVWVLAESHLVLHHWTEEGFATIDLHVCDYRGSNREKAGVLVDRLSEICFAPGASRWHELEVEAPEPLAAGAAGSGRPD